MKNNKIRTYPYKGLTIFMGLIFIFSIGIGLLVFFVEDILALKIFFLILCAFFMIGSLIVFLDQVCNYVEVKDDVVIKHMVIGTRKIKFNQIFRVRVVDGFYIVQMADSGNFAKFATTVPNSEVVVVYLEKHGVKILW